ncbi:MAG: hypothetical protein ACI4BC_01860 [Muribaculaceae bacterium]
MSRIAALRQSAPWSFFGGYFVGMGVKQKKLVVSRQPIFLNLKSNTMKNRCKGIAIILFEQEMGDKN